MLRFFSPLGRNDRGATAIEYAVIAGIIGLGLVGSLVATRGSLSAVFGTASSQMGSSSASGGSSPSSPAGAMTYDWAAKTLAQPASVTDNGGVRTTNFVYTDGVTVKLNVGSGFSQIQITDPSIQRIYLTSQDGSGNLNGVEVTQLNSSMSQFVRTETSYSLSGTPPTPTSVTTRLYSGGFETSSTTAAPSADFLSYARNGAGDYAYFYPLKK